MVRHTFENWLHLEVNAARCMLLSLYEQKDRLIFVEKPIIEKKYMDAVGEYELEVIREEMECELLIEKRKMIQVKMNRREPIDIAEIDSAIEDMRKKMLEEAIGNSEDQDRFDVTPKQAEELQEIYRNIVKNYHPQMHPDQPEAFKVLYQKAQDAYRRQDLTALKLIWEMFQATEESGIAIELSLGLGMGIDIGDGIDKRDYTTDYALAGKLYDQFVPFTEELPLREEQARYKAEIETEMNQIESIRSAFPFTASEMLNSPQSIEEYRGELEQRMAAARQERERLEQEIGAMLERAKKHG